MADEIAALTPRLERLEAIEACRCAFQEYLHYLDAGLRDELLEVSAPDGLLELMNFPLAEGTLRGGRPAVVAAASPRG